MMFTHISKMYHVLHKYLGQKLVPTVEEQEFLVELESGWTFYPSRIKSKLVEGEALPQYDRLLAVRDQGGAQVAPLRRRRGP